MFHVSVTPLPQTALLQTYAMRKGHHADCFQTTINSTANLSDYLEAFFASPIMKIERKLLGLFGYPSSQGDLEKLAHAMSDTFAGWTVEKRDDAQILLSVFGNGIRTWLMCQSDQNQTTLYFGSGVVPKNPEADQPKLGWPVAALMGFHTFYSKLVLWSARRQLERNASRQSLIKS